jgi:hypothetical protein
MLSRIAGWTTVAVIMLTLAANAANAQSGTLPPPCSAAFPHASSKTIGKTTWYNRQSSVENVVCDGFGLQPSADFPVTAGFVCAIVSQAIGAKAERLSLFIDGGCSGDAIASDPHEPATYIGVACGWASELLEKVAAPAGVLAGLGCAAAPLVGTSLGNILESKHELDVASDVVGRGKCLKYSPTHFGSPWLAVACSATDPGFSNLPQVFGTIGVDEGGDGSYTVLLNGRVLPPTLGASRASFGKPATVSHVGYKGDPDCRLAWPSKHITAVYFHGYGLPPSGGPTSSCRAYAGTFTAEFGGGWRTEAGVAVGASLATLRATYPSAIPYGSTWAIVNSYPGWGGNIVVLGAVIRNGRVAEFTVAGPESWDE